MFISLSLFASYLAGINLITWASYWYDKRAAIQGARRIPEIRLLLLAAFGGTPAAHSAQRILRHKTQKQPFRMYMQRITRWHKRLLILVFMASTVVLAQIYLTSGPQGFVHLLR